MDIDSLTSVLFVVALAVPRKPHCTSMVIEQIVKFVSEFCSTNVLPWLVISIESRVRKPDVSFIRRSVSSSKKTSLYFDGDGTDCEIRTRILFH